MIVKMKKLTLLVMQADRNQLLKRLRRLGTVHIKNIATPSADDIDSTESAIASLNSALLILGSYKEGVETKQLKWPEAQTIGEAEEIIALDKEKEVLTRDAQKREEEMAWYEPWGAFSPEDITALSGKGAFIRLYKLHKQALKKLGSENGLHIINRDKHYAYVALISGNPDAKLDFDEVKLSQKSFHSLCREQESAQKRIDTIKSELKIKAHAITCLKALLSVLEYRHKFLNAMHGMGKEEGFSYLQGFCPAAKIKDIAALAKSEGFGYLIEEPDNPEEAPTLIKNPGWISIISPVFRFMNTIPGYSEYDISLWFLLFFSLFFAMLIGDAGYGILFVVVTFLVRRKLKKAPPAPFILMYVLSFATIGWGVITGTWFGAEGIAQLPFFNALVIHKISSFAEGNQALMIFICFVIGVVQLTIAHIIKAVRVINSLKALAEIGWIMVLWGLFFLAGTLVVERPFPYFAGYLLSVGIGLLVLFSSPQKNILKAIATSLANIPLKIIGSFADIVSYLRLFAVGYASVVLASTFNNMAAGVGFNGIISTLGAALILCLGHGLNIVLGFMAVIVHGVRLNMLEFSGQMDMEWSGKEYDPFRENEKAAS